ncbi:MAG: amidohydrolase family protein [Promethearchaeota archaeon]|nr:MAG: amidohydrolase family protein [Candidatus Lokiarchaeota archaeon]
MLSCTIEQNGKKRIEHLLVIDAHSHLGQDVDGATMMNPLAPGAGTFDFWGNVQGRIKADWEKTGEQSFTTTMDGKFTKISWFFTPFPFTHNLYTELEKLGKRHSDLKEKSKFYSFIDQGVCFPFQDVFRGKYPEALYRASNINVSRFTTRFPFSMKLIGYGRCDPMEGAKAVNEVKYIREELGLRGLKLHPRSEGYIDKITSEKVINVLVEAASYSMPVIFDTRGRGSILEIGKLIRSARNVIQSNYPDLLPHFKVIIAHFAQGNIDDYEVYNTVVQPNTYGDLSMLHGAGAGNFFESFRNWYISNNKQRVDNRIWSEHLLFASDYPYFGDAHAQKLMKYIINKQFFDTGGTLTDVRNILGLNQLRLLPEYNTAQNQKEIKSVPSLIVSNPNFHQNKMNTYEISIMALAKLLVDNKFDIKRFCIQFKDTWDTFSEEVLLTILSNSSKQENNLLLMNLVKDRIALFAPLQSNMEWKKFGYNYFNPEDRAFFASVFKQNYLAMDMNKIVETFSYIYS